MSEGKSYEQKYKDMMDKAYEGMSPDSRKSINDFAKKMGKTEEKSRRLALDRSIEDLKSYDKMIKQASDFWSKAESGSRKIKAAYEGQNPVTMTYRRGIATIQAKLEKLNEHTKDANPRNDGSISADVFYAEEIPIGAIQNLVGNSAIDWIKENIEQDPFAPQKKKLIRVFARVKHLNFTPDPSISPAEPTATPLDHTRTGMLPQFYGLFDSGAPIPSNNSSIQVFFPDESDTSNGIIRKVDTTSARKTIKKTSAQKMFEKQMSVMMKDLLSTAGQATQ